MTQVIMIHSARGGVGKTTLASNLSICLAQKGKNVALLEMDFRAPCFGVVFGENNASNWMNDYIDDNCELDEAVSKISNKFPTRGSLYVGFANPELGAKRNIASKDVNWSKKSLQEILRLKDARIEGKSLDYAIIDTGHGVNFVTVNAAAAADLSLIVTSMALLGYESTRLMIKELYEPMQRTGMVIVNKTPVGDAITYTLNPSLVDFYNYPAAEFIPYYDELSTLRRGIFVYAENPDHAFSLAVDRIANNSDRMLSHEAIFMPKAEVVAPIAPSAQSTISSGSVTVSVPRGYEETLQSVELNPEREQLMNEVRKLQEELASLKNTIFSSQESSGYPTSVSVENLLDKMVDKMLLRLKTDTKPDVTIASSQGATQATGTPASSFGETVDNPVKELEGRKDSSQVKKRSVDEELRWSLRD